MSAIRAPLAVSLALPAFAACTTVEPFDYGPYLEHMPRSILVLPPLDETPEVGACYGYLSTVTHPLAERGYYVFPVGVVDRMMKENGLPTAGEMHQVSLAKLREIFGADAVLYMTVKEWGTSYRVLDSSTVVTVEGLLVDARTGATLWRGERTAASSSSSGQTGLAGLLASALVSQVMSSAIDQTPDVARQVNGGMFGSSSDGLLLGPYHPDYEADQQVRREELAARAAETDAG